MKKLLLTILFLVPTLAMAETVPAYPMLFYGSATINGIAAPADTVIHAYYGNTVAGEITLNELGVYGYDNPMKQQLLVREGAGPIHFTAQSSSKNGGLEIEQVTGQTIYSFTSGNAIETNLSFSYVVPAPTPTPTPTPAVSNPGGGGGGGPSIMYGCMDKKAINYSPIATADNKACVYPLGVTASTTTPIPAPVAQTSNIKPVGEVAGASTFVFKRNLNVGSTGIDVTELQKRLTAEGHYEGPITTYFGSLTGAGVKKYQSAHGLDAVGNVGPKTRTVLNGSAGSVLGAGTVSTSVTVLTPEARTTLIKQLLTMILELQKQLAALKSQQP